ncbi:response regulator [Arthrobacter sp. UYEF20]|uniref:response regulator transcription factor n=1 Tax=Arthrobacter sp. UYEF20 TaxID=1756363 RepID=UPI0033970462
MNSRGICLVIEDDPDIQGLLCLILSRAGFEVHAKATGAAGLCAAERLDLALITLDLGLPDLNGHDVARAIRKLSKAPLLMITASAETADELDGIAAGASSYLTKPFRPVQLRTLVQELWPPLSPVTTPAHEGIRGDD